MRQLKVNASAVKRVIHLQIVRLLATCSSVVNVVDEDDDDDA